MKLHPTEVLFLMRCLDGLKQDPAVQRMRRFRKHGRTDIYHHCERVAFYSLWLARRLRPLWKSAELHIDYQSLVRGAFLHDFYLYDWHTQKVPHRMHAAIHPALALKNAQEHFEITPKEADIIRHHMWPLTPEFYPRSIEAVIVSLTDKVCAAQETLSTTEGRSTRNNLL